jgi:ATP-dependent DNA ligase
VLYLDHVVAEGVRLFEAACQRDLEGAVAKLASAPYTPDETTWVNLNPA